LKLKFKHQKFQEDAAMAVCDVFAGQPFSSPTYIVDSGVTTDIQRAMFAEQDYTGYNNGKIIISNEVILSNLREVQKRNQIQPSSKLEGHYNLTIEMETGVGKTYTYIKTIYELNKRYGWCKFIVVVPSVAIREGVNHSFENTESHFVEDYNKKIRYFIYNSSDLTKIEHFASDSAINVMIINSQAFNARGEAARRIFMKLDSFRSRRPIDVIAATNPILIIDEPQSVEGAATAERLKDFNPLMTLRYSATHKKEYNLIYRLDAMEAYNKKLVKKISVKGITVSGTTGTEGYLYLEKINVFPNRAPTATLEFEMRGANGLRKVSRNVEERYNLHELSKLEEYRGYTVSRINALTNTVEFINGVVISAGDVKGLANEDHLRRIQIRETIKSHLERERKLFREGIKVLSLFFIDEVAKYKQYADSGMAFNGEYADIFEEEYKVAFENLQLEFGEEEYAKYLAEIAAENTHAGYFSIDKRSNHIIDGDADISDDSDAYDLIMKDKERLLNLDEPVRFIFSHSALREGWDNPNVFQICTLKQSSSDVRKRQEVGRGLRLCVNGEGERMDSNSLGSNVHNVNILTVVANESYDSFVKQLQTEIAEIVAYRPRQVTAALFEGRDIETEDARKIVCCLKINGYIDDNALLTEKYHEDVKSGKFVVSEELEPYKADIINIVSSVYDPKALAPEDARSNNVEPRVNESKLQMREFKELWNRINSKSAYVVDFDTEELIEKSIEAINKDLQVSKIFYRTDIGEMGQIVSKEALEKGEAFKKATGEISTVESVLNTGVKYDLIGKVVTETGLTRSAVAEILRKIDKEKFDLFSKNPEEFIIKTSNIINEQKATVIIEHITYNKLQEAYSMDIFTDASLKGKLGKNAMQTNKHIYDYLIYDSENEKNFAVELDRQNEVAVYVKLPGGFYINTPVGKYNPDWAIAFNEGNVRHIYFVAETKGDLSSMQLRKIEQLKIDCAREHFKAISNDSVKYDVVGSYQTLLEKVLR
jgi:type III restriction enzyme